MIILDTNAVSEALKPVPSEVVLNWLAAQKPLSVFITAITRAEILRVVELLPGFMRRQKPSAAVEDSAAIARSHGATVATRNTTDFERCGIRLINPWTAAEVH